MTDQEVQLFLAAWPSSPGRPAARHGGQAARPAAGARRDHARHSVPADSSGDAHLTVRAAPGAASDDLDQWVQDLGRSRLMGQR